MRHPEARGERRKEGVEGLIPRYLLLTPLTDRCTVALLPRRQGGLFFGAASCQR